MEIPLRTRHQDDRDHRPPMGYCSRCQHVSYLMRNELDLELMNQVRIRNPIASVPGQQEQARQGRGKAKDGV